MARNKGTELSVFKGREAKLNRAIFQALALKGPQTIYDIHKRLKLIRGLRCTHYGNVNKRMRDLESARYVREARVRSTKAGFETTEYELTAKAYLALMFDSIKLDILLSWIAEDAALEILAAIAKLC